MKLPRWFVKALLVISGGLFLVAASWWWVTWPTATLHQLTMLLEQGRFQEANHYLEGSAGWSVEDLGDGEVVVFAGATTHRRPRYAAATWQSWCTIENLQLDSRTIADLMCGRGRFSFGRQFITPIYLGGTVERGTVRFRCEPWAATP